MKNKNVKKVRIQFDMTKESAKKLDDLALKISEPTRSVVFRLALGLLGIIVDIQERGDSLYVVDKNGEKTRIVFAWK